MPPYGLGFVPAESFLSLKASNWSEIFISIAKQKIIDYYVCVILENDRRIGNGKENYQSRRRRNGLPGHRK